MKNKTKIKIILTKTVFCSQRASRDRRISVPDVAFVVEETLLGETVFFVVTLEASDNLFAAL